MESPERIARSESLPLHEEEKNVRRSIPERQMMIKELERASPVGENKQLDAFSLHNIDEEENDESNNNDSRLRENMHIASSLQHIQNQIQQLGHLIEQKIDASESFKSKSIAESEPQRDINDSNNPQEEQKIIPPLRNKSQKRNYTNYEMRESGSEEGEGERERKEEECVEIDKRKYEEREGENEEEQDDLNEGVDEEKKQPHQFMNKAKEDNGQYTPRNNTSNTEIAAFNDKAKLQFPNFHKTSSQTYHHHT